MTLNIDIFRKHHNGIDELFSDINKVLNNSKFSKQFYQSSETNILKYFSLICHLHSIQSKNSNIAMSIDKQFQIITINFNQRDNVNHYFKLKSSQNGNYTSYSHSLPELDQLQCEFEDIQQAVDVFNESLLDLNEYFETMADLDRCCWIIDPSLPTYKDNFRRIVVGDNVSILVTVDYKNSRDMPNICVLGPTIAIETFSDKIHKYSDKWNTDLNITINLLYMLDISEFPTKPTVEDGPTDEAIDIDCGICFSARDYAENLPNVVCENSQCGQNFHATCLYQWLSAVSSNVQTFDTIHGECPSCLTSISCAVVELT